MSRRCSLSFALTPIVALTAKDHKIVDRLHQTTNMNWFGQMNSIFVSVLLNGVVPIGISAFVLPPEPAISRTLPGFRSECKKFHIPGHSIFLKAKDGSSEFDFEVPSPRWTCPIHEDICSETGVTLSRYMKEMVRANPELEEIESSTLFCNDGIVC